MFNNYFYIDSKSFLVEAYDEEWREFFVFINSIDKIVSIERVNGNYPKVTVCEYETLDDLIEDTNWLDYILTGIKNPKLEDKLRAKQII